MSVSGDPNLSSLSRMAEQRQRIMDVRDRAFRLFQSGATGIQVGAALSEGIDSFLTDTMDEAAVALEPALAEHLRQHAAMIAVGGSGRGEISPYSDTDLLFLYSPAARDDFPDFAAGVMRQYWDAKLKLGHSVRTIGDALAMARQEPQFATSLVDLRLLWGSEELLAQLRKLFHRKIVSGRLQAFVDDCIRGRLEERQQFGATVLQLEPDVKRSLGGLRDVHLLRWIGFAHYGTTDPHSLRLRGALSKDDSRRLLTAYEFVLRIRADLHFQAGKPQDVLIRDEQLRIARERDFPGRVGLRPVEQFMQEYFHHSSAIAEVSHRFTQAHQPRSLTSRLLGSMLSHRFDGICRLSPDGVTVIPRERAHVCSELSLILKLFLSAARYGVGVAPEMLDQIKEAVPALPDEVTLECARIFRRILRTRGCLGLTLRSMFETRVLELVIPDFKHVRCLLQFNQYHQYTVDEHTLRAIEIAEQFETDDGPVGTAYRSIQHKATLHLAILLHDAGKGFDEDHSEVGRRIAERVAERLRFGEHKQEMLVFLVHKHLEMAQLAFWRDFSDPAVLVPFARSVGSPEILRMLYVLTVADISAVGPKAWTDWKAELLAGLFDQAMLILSGKHLRHHEDLRIRQIKDQIQSSLRPLDKQPTEQWNRWIEDELDQFPPHYLFAASPEKIVSDMAVLQTLQEDDIVIDGEFDRETDTVEYRVITRGRWTDGCFHKICGVLTANRLGILEAQISTSLNGTVVDRFRVHDKDFSDEVPQIRIDEVCQSIRGVLTGQSSVADLFRRHKRFGTPTSIQPISGQISRVVIDNDSTRHATIIDIFAHDRPGLLYTVARAIYERGLSIKLAKIGTHLDQVVDVFYVCDEHGDKLQAGREVRELRDSLIACLNQFESTGHRQFIS